MTTLGIALLILVFVVFMYMVMMKKGGGCCGGSSQQNDQMGGSCCMGDSHEPHDHHNEPESNSGTDPVCGMTVDNENGLSSQHQGKHYAFCSEHCQKSFDADPGKYV
jgi:YHS domain-containing protein